MHLIDRRKFFAGLAASAVSSSFADAPRSAFGPQSTAEDVTNGLDLSGKTAESRRAAWRDSIRQLVRRGMGR